jgi:hypothetical protein
VALERDRVLVRVEIALTIEFWHTTPGSSGCVRGAEAAEHDAS